MQSFAYFPTDISLSFLLFSKPPKASAAKTAKKATRERSERLDRLAFDNVLDPPGLVFYVYAYQIHGPVIALP